QSSPSGPSGQRVRASRSRRSSRSASGMSMRNGRISASGGTGCPLGGGRCRPPHRLLRKESFRDRWQTCRAMDTSERLLKLLSLLQARPDWTGRELAERLGVSGRTVRNDVERLRRLGYPVHASPGVGGGYRLGAGGAPSPLLLGGAE